MSFVHALWRFVKRETVLAAAILLAAASMILVPPDAGYLSYIDWDTLSMLFSLMAVMKGFQKAGLFEFLGSGLLHHTRTSRGMMLVLVFLPFVCSMVVTNDVSLITFVPFALVVLRLAGQEKLVVPVVVMQTVAANLGSMLTPMGNPQNLYLFNRSGMGFGEVAALHLPYALLAAAGLFALCCLRKREETAVAAAPAGFSGTRPLIWSAAGFVLCLFGIFNLLPPVFIAAVVALFLLFADRRLLLSVDYSLLGTFIAFFIFIGNLGSIGPFRDFLSSVLSGHEVPVAVLASQVISNVPAALLLSGFSDNWAGLMVGCNLGGLGTLIASMASLISYKLVARDYPAEKGRYFKQFTLYNLGFLAALLALWWLLGTT